MNGAKLRRISSQAGEPVGYLHWCPGCKCAKAIHVQKPSTYTGAQWTFDGNFEAPTFSPSILCFSQGGKWEGDKWVREGPRITTCHYFIRNGMIQFLSDCAHALAGQTVPLPDWPQDEDS